MVKVEILLRNPFSKCSELLHKNLMRFKNYKMKIQNSIIVDISYHIIILWLNYMTMYFIGHCMKQKQLSPGLQAYAFFSWMSSTYSAHKSVIWIFGGRNQYVPVCNVYHMCFQTFIKSTVLQKIGLPVHSRDIGDMHQSEHNNMVPALIWIDGYQ